MRNGQSIQELLEEFSAVKDYGLHSVLRQARARGAEFDLERSVRVESSGVFPLRLLVSFEHEAFHQAFSPDVFLPCTWMNIPEESLDRLKTFFAKAWRIHFGWEQGVRGWIGKMYIELRPRQIVSHDPLTSDRFEPGQLLFLGYKWPLNGQGSSVVSKYKILAHLPAKESLDRWKQSLGTVSHGSEPDAVSRLVEVLSKRDLPKSRLLLLEVSDEGSPRVSHDINLYDLEQSVESIHDELVALTAMWSPSSVQQAWSASLRSIADERLGHLASGIDRNGSIFWTLYYGAIRVLTRED
jgi:hypothetical protein